MLPSALSHLVAAPEPDAELLERFAHSRDECAFAALVQRFGPMVLAVCRRAARDAHLAEDAFQAAFVVLARRASEVRPATAVRGWLYGVAVRCAKGVRAVQARNSSRETPVAEVPDRAAEERDPPDADALAALDEAVARLPEHLRAAVLLCELEGLSRAEAASRLGIAEGTLSSRLAKARKLLARALHSRGVALPTAGLAALGTSVPVSARLAAETSALLHADALPPAVAALTGKVFRAMFVQKLKLAIPLLALVLGALVWGALALAADPPAPPVVPVPKPAGDAKALPKGPNKLVYYHNDHIVTANPDGTGATRIVNCDKYHLVPGRLAFAPDGSAILVQPAICGAMAGPIDTHLVRLNPEIGSVTVAGLGKVRKLDKNIYPYSAQERAVCWSADGTKVLETGAAEDDNGKRTLERYGHQITDLATGTGTKIDLPSDQRVFDWGPDGSFLAVQLVPAKTVEGYWDPKFRLWILDAKGKPETEIESPDDAFYPNDPKFARDGRKVLFSLMRKAHDKVDNRHFKSDEGLVVYDRDTKKTARVDLPKGARVMSSCWSPDGTKIAYSWHTTGKKADDDEKKDDEELDWFVTVADASGANAKHVVKARGTRADYPIGEVAWR